MVSPEQPFLFFPEGPDIRWRSFAGVAAQASAGAAELGGLGLAPGARVAYRWHSEPDAVAADLAIRAGGWTAVPIPGRRAPVTSADAPAGRFEELERTARELGCAALLLPPGADVALGDGPELPRAALPAAGTGASPGGIGTGAQLPELPGDAAVLAPGRVPAVSRTLSAEEIGAWGTGLAERLAPALREVGGSAGRAVVVACFDPSGADGRALLAWAERAAPALFIEPDRASLAGSAAWARGSLVAGEGEPIARLAAEIRRRTARSPLLRRLLGRPGGTAGAGRLPRRGPFGRLRAVILLGEGGLGADALATFARYRIAVLRARA